MKLTGRDAKAYFRKPDPEAAGALLFGADAMRVSMRRQELILALVGPEAEAEMRLARLSGADLRKEPALLQDAVKAQGFFPGPRAVFVEGATDGLADVFSAALEDWRPGDAQIIATAGQLAAKSKLRKLFEGHRAVYAAGIYDDPPGRDEIEAMLRDAGPVSLSEDGMGALLVLSRAVDPGDFRQTVEKLALYMRGSDAPASATDVEAVAPRTREAELDELLDIVADRQSAAIGVLLSRLYSQGVAPVGICIGTMRHFRTLYAISTDPGGPASGISKLRPPVFGPRRDKLLNQSRNWGVDSLQRVLSLLTETDLSLRSSSPAPSAALMERALIRIAMTR